jgi:hypothetical protein
MVYEKYKHDKVQNKREENGGRPLKPVRETDGKETEKCNPWCSRVRAFKKSAFLKKIYETSTIKMETVCSSGTLETNKMTARCH